MNHLKGKSIIVTGGGSGIGQAAARLLGEAGCDVTVADLNVAGGTAVATAIEQAGGRAQFVRTDVSDESGVRRMVDSAVAAYGRLDGACNAAGVPQRGKLLHDVTLEEWDHCFAVNLRGLFMCNKYQIAAMLETGGGSIVNIASTAAFVGFPNGGEYCASKAGVMGLVRGAAIDYATKGIRVNAVLPGGTLTPMLQGAIAQDKGLEAALLPSTLCVDSASRVRSPPLCFGSFPTRHLSLPASASRSMAAILQTEVTFPPPRAPDTPIRIASNCRQRKAIRRTIHPWKL